MNKYFFYIFPIVAISIIIASLLADKYNTASQEEVYEATKTPMDTIEIYKVRSFLANTTYFYCNYGRGTGATLIDSTFTPPVKASFNSIAVQIKGNTAITGIGYDCVTHKILSAEYYEIGCCRLLAILHTNKGEIRIARGIVYDPFECNEYSIYFTYNNVTAYSHTFGINTQLPSPHIIKVKD